MVALGLSILYALTGGIFGKKPSAPAVDGPFPKRCNNCKRVHASRAAWSRLEWYGFMDDGDGGLLALRHCPCRSTLSVAARFDDALTRTARAPANVIVHQGGMS